MLPLSSGYSFRLPEDYLVNRVRPGPSTMVIDTGGILQWGTGGGCKSAGATHSGSLGHRGRSRGGPALFVLYGFFTVIIGAGGNNRPPLSYRRQGAAAPPSRFGFSTSPAAK